MGDIDAQEQNLTLGIDTGHYFCAFSVGYNRSNYTSEDADTDMSSFFPGEIPNT